MNAALRYISLFFALLFTNPCAHSQVEKIKESARNDNRSSYATYASSSTTKSSYPNYEYQTFGESLAESIVMGIIGGVGFLTVKAQKGVLNNKKIHPQLVSLQAGFDYGSNLSELSFNPSVRANWGLLATDFRYALLHDHTGSLESLDWQVLIVRIPIKNIKLNYGIGFTSLMSPKTTYFESSTGFDIHMCKRKLNLSGDYRWTSRKIDQRYRQELKFTGDYQLIKNNHFSFSPMAGITYQDYYKTHNYLLFNVGVRMRLIWE